MRMGRVVNHEMIQLARESRGLTQKELSERTYISQGHISKLERGQWSIPKLKLKKIAEVLEYPETFFYEQPRLYGFDLSFIFHRRRQSISRVLLKKLEAQANIRIMQVDDLLDAVELDSPNEFVSMDIEDYDHNPARIAKLLRAKWNLPIGPVKNLTETIEDAGGFVFQCEFETKKLEGMSVWPKNNPPLFFVNRDIPADRLRFSLAHELGHIIMHRFPTNNIEDEANRFASEFLMPQVDMRSELQAFSLHKAMILKSKWKVSIAAIVKRAYDLGVIPKSKYSSLFREINYRGIRFEEPIDLPEEKPSLFSRILEIYKSQLGYTVNDLCRQLNILPKHFIKVAI